MNYLRKHITLFTLFVFVLTSCNKDRSTADKEVNKLDPTFAATTTPVHVYSANAQTYACFYENNYVLLTAFQPTIKKYKWFKVINNKEYFLSDQSEYKTSEEGLYKLEIRDELPNIGTIDTSVHISLDHCPTFIDPPKAFTPLSPNNFSTSWKPVYSGVRTVYLKIESEDGVVLFETEKLDEGWDGYFKGKMMPQGTYKFYLSGSYKSGYLFEISGTLELTK